MEPQERAQRDTRLLEMINVSMGNLLARLQSRSYNMTVQVYTDNAYVPVARDCFAFMVTNVGDTTATVNGMVLFPSATPLTALGDSRTIAAHELDVYTGNITLSFRPVVGPAPGVEVVQLYYTI
jgi:hypothetical protein